MCHILLPADLSRARNLTALSGLVLTTSSRQVSFQRPFIQTCVHSQSFCGGKDKQSGPWHHVLTSISNPEAVALRDSWRICIDRLVVGCFQGRISINQANVTYSDGISTNGIFHEINRVLFPPDVDRQEPDVPVGETTAQLQIGHF